MCCLPTGFAGRTPDRAEQFHGAGGYGQVLTALAASTDVADRLRLPGWLDRGDARTAALVTSLVATGLVLGASMRPRGPVRWPRR